MILEGEFPKDERVRKEALTLSKRGFVLTVLCFRDGNSEREEEWQNIRVIRKPLPWLINKFKPLLLSFPFYEIYWERHILTVLKSNSFDVLHVHDLPLLRLSRKISLLKNMTLVVDLHENRPEIMRLYNFVTRFPGSVLISIDKWIKYQQEQVRGVDKLILVSREASEYYKRNRIVKDNCRISVIPNYPSIAYLENVEIDNLIIRKYSQYFTAVYMGDTSLRRGTLDILKAAKELRDEKNIRFIILGNSSEQKILEDYVMKENLENVELTGFVPFERSMSYIAAAKVGISPLKRNDHHDTTYAAKIFNYMYFGKPIIVSDCPSQENLVNELDVGMVFKDGDYGQLAEMIVRLNNEEQLYSIYSVNARDAVKKRLNWESLEDELIGIYE
ncbi:MAG: glycosyltransferase family 4 protein [Bacteroidales bacterium]